MGSYLESMPTNGQAVGEGEQGHRRKEWMHKFCGGLIKKPFHGKIRPQNNLRSKKL